MVASQVGIVGAGLVGLAVARQLAQSGTGVVVWEKEAAVARHQSGHNSGVAHAGIYYAPGSAKARNCRRGVELLRAYCQTRGLAWDERGKLVVARNETEEGRLRELERRSLANGVPGVRWLDGAQIRELEPDVAGVAALLSPTTAIVDFPAVARAFADDVTAAGGEVRLSTPVGAIRRSGDGVEVVTPGATHKVGHLVICAGLETDLVARAAGDEVAPEIVPFRGEYLRLRPEVRDRVRHLIYPVPDPAYPFLGIHLTPRTDGEVDLGPNAVLALSREGYRRRDISAAELARLGRSAAFRRLARKHWRAGVREVRGSLSRAAFLAEARTYLPWLEAGHVTGAPAGVRAQAVDPDGSLVDDFRIHRLGQVTAVRNAPSPAATASLAIAEQIISELSLSPHTGT
ncbi:MAG TPA: L-2-hydroxyglutarate oxidase [Streptosporangiaceae bacterium]|nr:L-2-hydroxyglutarate oxidase [Streptosporangiaceae bacterium]